MPFRVFGYEGASYRSQYGKKKRRKYPVVTLVLYYGQKHWKQPKNLKSLLNVPEELDEYVNDIKINVFEISWLTEEQIELFQSDFKVIADYFVQKRKNKGYIPSEKAIKHVDAFLKMMSVFADDTRYEELVGALKTEGGPVTMCEVLDAYEKRGHEAGRREGHEAGRREGHEVGRREGIFALIEALKELGQSTEFIIAKISEKFGLSEQEARYYMQ